MASPWVSAAPLCVPCSWCRRQWRWAQQRPRRACRTSCITCGAALICLDTCTTKGGDVFRWSCRTSCCCLSWFVCFRCLLAAFAFACLLLSAAACRLSSWQPGPSLACPCAPHLCEACVLDPRRARHRGWGRSGSGCPRCWTICPPPAAARGRHPGLAARGILPPALAPGRGGEALADNTKRGSCGTSARQFQPIAALSAESVRAGKGLSEFGHQTIRLSDRFVIAWFVAEKGFERRANSASAGAGARFAPARNTD